MLTENDVRLLHEIVDLLEDIHQGNLYSLDELNELLAGQYIGRIATLEALADRCSEMNASLRIYNFRRMLRAGGVREITLNDDLTECYEEGLRFMQVVNAELANFDFLIDVYAKERINALRTEVSR